jgi:hypothetical protein
MPRGPRRRQGSISIKVSGLCFSCGGTRSSQFHPTPQELSDFYLVCKMLAQVAKRRQCDCAIVATVAEVLSMVDTSLSMALGRYITLQQNAINNCTWDKFNP